MIEIFGPTYKYQGEILEQPEIIYIQDHHYDEDDQCFHVKHLIANSTCNPDDHLILFNNLGHEDQLQQQQHVCLPIYLSSVCSQFNKQNIVANWKNKTHTFNFMINKPRMHRQFLLLLLEYFELKDFKHTLTWSTLDLHRDNMKQYTANDLYCDIIDTTQVNIPFTNYMFGPETLLPQGIMNGVYTNSEIYQNLLQSTVFEPSCVSLITEPAFFQKETQHTEKTVMAIYGGTMPIWVGGWKLAEHLRKLGFDVFDDVIDHSYENMLDPWDRCYYAIKYNIDLLRNRDQTMKFLANNTHRLEHNLRLLRNNVFLSACLKRLNQYTGSRGNALRSTIPHLCGDELEFYRHNTNYRLFGDIPQGAIK